MEQDQRACFHPDVRGRLGRPDCGRNRRHEHHAGERHGAHPRNWCAQSHRRAPQQHPRTVSDRGGNAQRYRRRHRRYLWLWAYAAAPLRSNRSGRAVAFLDCRRAGHVRAHRHRLRRLSCLESCAPRSRRGPSLRIATNRLSGIVRGCRPASRCVNFSTHMAGDQFPVTRWSVIDAVKSADAAERTRAMDTLFAAYWKPVYKYVRLRWNRPVEDAQDLTQGFFAEMLERELLTKYNPAKSKLRTYLRLCVDSFVMNQEKAARRQKRGGNTTHVALDFHAAEEELAGNTIDVASIPSHESLEEFFEKEWV